MDGFKESDFIDLDEIDDLLGSLFEDDESNNDDEVFRQKTKTQITNRDSKYTDLLTHFVKITKIRNIIKEIFKWLFFIVIMGSLICLLITVLKLFNRYIFTAEIDDIISSSAVLVASIASVASTIIAVPIVVTKYLFNTDEDKNITQIILHTQEHDTNGRQWAMELKKIEKMLSDKEETENNKEEKADNTSQKQNKKRK